MNQKGGTQMDAVGTIVHDPDALQDMIRKSGITKTHIANNLGINQTTLDAKISGRNDFWWHEAVMLKNILRMTDDEFKKIFGW